MHAHRGKFAQQHNEKEAVCEPRRKALGETKPVDAFILGFQPPEQRNKRYLSHPLCGTLLCGI